MARILFAWEVGDNSGHVVPFLPWLAALQARGHEVTVAARDTGEVGERVHAAGLALAQAPACMKTFGGIAEAAIDYPEILQHHGYAHEATLTGLMLAWRTLFDDAKPDLVIANNSPLAIRTAALRGIPRIRVGSGFNCPPLAPLMPELRPRTGDTLDRREATEARIVRALNAAAARIGDAPIEHTCDLFDGCATWLFTFPELDHYSRREGGHYLGLPAFIPPSPEATVPGAPRAFAYLRMDHPHTEAMLATLQRSGVSALAYVPDIDDARLERLGKGSLRIVREPADTRRALAQARVVISHAGHNLTAESLLCGIPVLALPGHLEQDLVAANVERIGAGIRIGMGERHPKLHVALSRLLEEPGFRAHALGFSAAHHRTGSDDFLETLCHECERLAHSTVPLRKSA